MSKNSTQYDYNFNVIHEQVADIDLFEDKTHQKVSNSLFQLIKTTEKGLTIGLEGGWGSGKSTVINLLRDSLEKDKEENTLFFMFDAWAHDGDPLRKIFLESLISSIDPEGNDDKLNNFKDEVTARKKTVKVTTQKTASKLGKILSGSAIFIPIGAALLSSIDYSKVFSPWNELANGPYWILWFSLLFSFAPVLVLVYWALLGDSNAKGGKTWDIFESQSTETFTQDITEDGERTSIEFERFFAQILEYVLCDNEKYKYNRAVVVIDNLDRVEPEHAKNIWSTLQTFFQYRSSKLANKKKIWNDQLWFVVPFDKEGLTKIWLSDSHEPQASGPMISNDKNAAASFLDKCFQVTATVPQPVMSAWVNYLDISINKALTGWPENERIEVFETYQRFASNLEQSPTPRQIQVTVNQIGMIGLTWGGVMTAEALCFYAIVRQNMSEGMLRLALLETNLPNNYQSKTNINEFKSELSGLLFGVDKNKGIQLLLAPEIHSAMRNADSDLLKGLVDKHGSAFWIAWESKKSTWLITSEHTDDYKISCTSAIYHGLRDYRNNIRYDIPLIIEAWKGSFDNWQFKNINYVEPIRQITELSSNRSDLLTWLNQKVSQKLTFFIKMITVEIFPETELMSLHKLIKYLETEQYPVTPMKQISLELNYWKIWLDKTADFEDGFACVLPNNTLISQMAAETSFNQTALDLDSLGYLSRTLVITPNNSEWSQVIDNVISWGNMPNRTIDCEAYYEFILNLVSTHGSKEFKKFEEAIIEPTFWARITDATIINNPSLPLVAAIFCKDKLQDLAHVSQSVKTFWATKQSEIDIDSLYSELKSISQLSSVWELARDDRNIVAVQIIRQKQEAALYSLAEGAQFIDEYEWMEQKEISTISSLLCQFGSFKNNHDKMLDNQEEYHKVFSIFYKFGDESAKNFIKQEISKISKEDWSKYLIDNSHLLRCLQPKNHKFSDAFRDFLVSILIGETKLSDDWIFKNIDYLFEHTVDTDSHLLPKLIETYFNAEKENLVDMKFESIAPYFEKHLNKITSTLYMNKLVVWLDLHQYERISWLLKFNLETPEILHESLIERVREGLKSESHLENDIFDMLNQKLNLGIEQEIVSDKPEVSVDKIDE